MTTGAKKLFIFSSKTNAELHAFTDVGSGKKLPEKHGPWVSEGFIAAGDKPPYGFAREDIQKGIAEWSKYTGHAERARPLLEKVLAGGQWTSIGYMAAEAELRP